jgi:hypothetical protein
MIGVELHDLLLGVIAFNLERQGPLIYFASVGALLR